MKLGVQRGTKASCKVDGAITGQIDQGFMVLVGFCAGDDIKTVTAYTRITNNVII